MQNFTAENFAKLHRILSGAEHGVLLATHERPDADAIGAVYALAHVSAYLKKPAWAFLPDGVPEELSFLTTDIPRYVATHDLKGDVLVAVDYGDFIRTKLDGYTSATPHRIVTIDHHPPRDHRGELIIVDTDASSTCEIIHRYVRHAGVPLTKDLATCLLAGIVFDTGGLKHSNTSKLTFAAVSDLIRHGARMHKVTKGARTNTESATLRAIATALSRIEYDAELSMSYTYLRIGELAEAGAEADVSIVAQLLGTGNEHKFSAFFKEDAPDSFRVNLRSENFKGVDVSKIAGRFGGGGHMYASGCRIDGGFDDVLAKFKEAARAELER